MRTSVGFWDSLFGKRITLELPSPDGTVRKVQVTEKWFQEMQRQGKVSPITGTTVKVNVLDPMGGTDLSNLDAPSKLFEAVMEPKQEHLVETWTVGKEISHDQYQRFVDPQTQELYVLIKYDKGKRSRHTVPRSLWNQAKQMMDSI